MSEAAEVLFQPQESERFARDLERVDRTLSTAAAEFGCKYLSSAGRGWPGRRLRKRVGLRTYELRLLLNPNYLQDDVVHYELREQWMYDLGEILTKMLSQRVIGTLSPENLADALEMQQLVRTTLTIALSQR